MDGMLMKTRVVVAAAFFGAILASTAFAQGEHADLADAIYKTGQDVTAECLNCHEKEAADFMKTPHWNWCEEQTVGGKKMELGKKNVINNF